MKVKAKNFVWVLCALFFLNASFFAAVQKENIQIRRKIRRNVSTLMLMRMTQALNLTEEQTAKIFPEVNRIEKEKMELFRQIIDQIKDLKEILKEEAPSADNLEKKVEEIKKLRASLQSIDKELETFVENQLTPVQKAKFIIFSQDFYRDLREKLDRARVLREQREKKNAQQF